MKKHYIVPLFVPHKGCPNDCIFCNQKRISGCMDALTPEDIQKEIQRYLSYFPDCVPYEIAFYGGSFTGIEKGLQEDYLSVAAKFITEGQCTGIRISTRPDYIDEHVLATLQRYGVKTIELGVQSMVDDVLAANQRGHTAAQVEHAAHLIRQAGFVLGLQMMLGLFGDTDDGARYTASRFIQIKPDMARIYPTLVIRDTALEKLYREGSYQALSMEHAVGLAAEILVALESAGIQVIRIGLQPTDNIHEGADVLAGPFHASFSQLCRSRAFLNEMCREIDKILPICEDEIVIHVPEKLLSIAIGQKKENIVRLKSIYTNKYLRIMPDYSMETGCRVSKKGEI